MTVRDAKVPYIFLAGGDHGDFQEPPGRQLFTLVLMTVLVARGIFAPVVRTSLCAALDALAIHFGVDQDEDQDKVGKQLTAA